MDLHIRHLSKKFHTKRVIEDLTLSFPSPGITVLMGPSGCGKTTLLQLLAGILKPDAGHMEGIGDQRTAFVFQEDRLLPWRNALDNMLVVTPDPAPPAPVRERAQQLLAQMDLPDAGSKMPAELSGGMRQRVAIARAILYDAPFYFLDEPFKNLDRKRRRAVMELLYTALREKNVLLVTHDVEEAATLADRVLLLGGPPLCLLQELRCSHTAAERMDHPALLESFRNELLAALGEIPGGDSMQETGPPPHPDDAARTPVEK